MVRLLALLFRPLEITLISTISGSVEFTAFPSSTQPSKPHVLQLPHVFTTNNRSTSINGQPYTNGKGPVCAMEWSSDGYVLAVGWEHGWAVWSVAGRCLAWGFGVEEQVDEERFQDAFMYGVRDLVSTIRYWVQGSEVWPVWRKTDISIRCSFGYQGTSN